MFDRSRVFLAVFCALSVAILQGAPAPQSMGREGLEGVSTAASGELGHASMRDLRLDNFLIYPPCCEGYWSYGQDGSLNPTASYPTAATNRMVDSENMTGAGYVATNITVNDATHATFTAQNGYLRQGVTTVEGVQYTFLITIARVTGNTDLHLRHENSADGTYTAQTITDTLTDYAVSFSGRTGGGSVYVAIQDRNTAGFGQIEVTRWAVIPGTHTAAAAALIYERVNAGRFDSFNWTIPANQRVNLLEDTDAVIVTDIWHGPRRTITAGQADFDGGTSAFLMTADGTAASTHYMYQDTVAEAGEWSVSAYLKNDGQDWLRLYAQAVGGGAAPIERSIKTSDCTLGSAGVKGTWTIVDAGSGWCRIEVYGTVAGDTDTVRLSFFLAEADGDYTFDGDGSSGIVIYAPQWESGTTASAFQAKNAANYRWRDLGHGSDPDADDTGDAGNRVVTEVNEAIPGTTENLEHASWAFTDAAADNATQFTPSALDGQAVQAFTGINGASYLVSAKIASAGNTSLEWTLDGVETGVTVTGSEVRYSIAYTGDGAAANIGLRDPNAAGFGAITFTEVQITQVPTGWTDPLPYVSSAEPSISCVGCEYSTDDYSTADALAGEFSGEDKPATFVTLFKYAVAPSGDEYIFGFTRLTTATPLLTVRVGAGNTLAFFIRDDVVAGTARNATETFETGLWNIVIWSTTGKTLSGYLNGAPLTLDSSDVDVGTVTLEAATVGALRRTSTTNFVTAAIAQVTVDNSAWSAAKSKRITCELAQEMWDERGIPVLSAAAACPTLTFD